MTMDQSGTLIMPCLNIRPDRKLCNTLIGIHIGSVPSAFICPICKSIYVIDPLHPQDPKMEGFGLMEQDGHRIEIYSGKSLHIIENNPERFYTLQGIKKVYQAEVLSEPGKGQDVIPNLLGKTPKIFDTNTPTKQQFTHNDYELHLFDRNERVEGIKDQILANCTDMLDDLTDFIHNMFLKNSKIVARLPYAKVETIRNMFLTSVVDGFNLYTCVVNVNNLRIQNRPNLDTAKIYNSFAQDAEYTDSLLKRYDIWPLIYKYIRESFKNFINENPEFQDYPFGEVERIRSLLGYAVQQAYLLCMVACS